ncbi:hypothetical protein PLEOSDRAFT_170010 [Pleurotus ostreatus PC15]|uniref:Uncharacterized protein n=1 Tax=Pleurotus ostreatus (strain PC15) TaxID=1137138 RepID=A0A067NB90_PLEO1|nr:hypothetical protein PLEOSDRAFT_170010 [Pleurotus ostreatus PC15]
MRKSASNRIAQSRGRDAPCWIWILLGRASASAPGPESGSAGTGVPVPVSAPGAGVHAPARAQAAAARPTRNHRPSDRARTALSRRLRRRRGLTAPRRGSALPSDRPMGRGRANRRSRAAGRAYGRKRRAVGLAIQPTSDIRSIVNESTLPLCESDSESTSARGV